MLAAIALRGGGILAVLTRCHHQPGPRGALVDPTGAIAAAAQNADLLYLQHIVIPTGPLKPPSPQVSPPVSPMLTPSVFPPELPHRGNLDAAGNQDIAHIDLLVFAKPHSSRALTCGIDDHTRHDLPAACDPVSAQLDPR